MDSRLDIRLTTDERAAIDRAAERAGARSSADWARKILVSALDDPFQDLREDMRQVSRDIDDLRGQLQTTTDLPEVRRTIIQLERGMEEMVEYFRTADRMSRDIRQLADSIPHLKYSIQKIVGIEERWDQLNRSRR